MSTGQETLMSWLRDAHAMEVAAADTLDRLEDSFSRLPHIAAQFREHREVSRAQAARIEQSLRALGSDSSLIKDVATRTLATAQLYATAATSDHLVKRFLGACTFSSFEIASYLALAAAARSLREEEVERMCAAHLAQERSMARWLEDRVGEVTLEYLRP